MAKDLAKNGPSHTRDLRPNTFRLRDAGEYLILAKRDIKSDEEIALDYEMQTTRFYVLWECKCGAANCRGMHAWDFLLLPPKTIFESLPFLDPWFARVQGEKSGPFFIKS